MSAGEGQGDTDQLGTGTDCGQLGSCPRSCHVNRTFPIALLQASRKCAQTQMKPIKINFRTAAASPYKDAELYFPLAVVAIGVIENRACR